MGKANAGSTGVSFPVTWDGWEDSAPAGAEFLRLGLEHGSQVMLGF